MTGLLKSWLDHFSPEAQAAIIAAVVGLVAGFIGPAVKHFWDRWSLRHRLRIEHEYSERKKLRELISKFHGWVLEAAESLNHRLWNLQKNQGQGWLKLNGHYEEVGERYYFRTTIYRMLEFLRRLKDFQDQAIYIDARIAERTDVLLPSPFPGLDTLCWHQRNSLFWRVQFPNDFRASSLTSAEHFSLPQAK